jgi:hypothetical protein
MRKWTVWLVAVCCALVLGWMAGGRWASLSTGAATPQGAVSGPQAAPKAGAAGNQAGDTSGQPQGAAAAVDQLVPAAGTTPWLRPVLWTLGGLFVAAVVVGVLLRRAQVRDPSNLATEFDQAQAERDRHGAGEKDHSSSSSAH